jgi:hypothetical protein
MIAPLRRRHRVVVTALALAVPPVLLAGLAARRPPAFHLPSGDPPRAAPHGSLTLLGDELVLLVPGELGVADPLLYAVEEGGTTLVGGPLPSGARFVRAIGEAATYRIPVSSVPGRLVLYGGADGKVVAEYARP